MKNNEKLSQREISPLLAHFFQLLSSQKPPKNLKQYISEFNFISLIYRQYLDYVLRRLEKPIYSTEMVLENLNADFQDLYDSTLKVSEECYQRYVLSSRQGRILQYNAVKNKQVLKQVKQLCRQTKWFNKQLFVFYEEIRSVEIPCKNDFSKIRKIPIHKN